MDNKKIVTINGKKNNITPGADINDQPSKKPRIIGRSMDFARSKRIEHFGPRNIATAAQPKPGIRKISSDIAPVRHPLANKVDQIREQAKIKQAQANATKPAQIIKQESIAEALAKPTPTDKPINNGFYKRHMKFINISSICILLAAAIGYVMYINIPNISVCFASTQAGISATFPEYRPDGYSLDGPVTYGDNEVTISFRANTGKAKFTIKQSKSSWDSSAVKNMINKSANGSMVTTTEERGLTIYSYDGNAAWVNGGILYTITGNAPLSNDQIRRIATSL